MEFVESAEHGVVYMSFGTIVNPAMLPEKYILTFVNVFKKLKQKVMWKWIAEKPSNLSDNVMIRDWFPQSDVLGKYRFDSMDWWKANSKNITIMTCRPSECEIVYYPRRSAQF